jgi:hypothetical protein
LEALIACQGGTLDFRVVILVAIVAGLIMNTVSKGIVLDRQDLSFVGWLNLDIRFGRS